MKTALVIGGGFAGCAAAHQLALAGGWDVTLIEAGPYLGAGVRTQWLGGHPYTFGPRHFLTQKEDIWAFMDKYVPLRRCQEHEFLTYVEQDRQFYTYPIHEDDLYDMPDWPEISLELGSRDLRAVAGARNLEEFWRFSVGETLYDKFVNTYSKKMWGVESNTEIDDFGWSPKGVTLKSGPRACWDTALSGYPVAPNGYDDYFKIATAEVTVLLNTKINRGHYNIKRRSISFGEYYIQSAIDGSSQKFDVIVNTISPDILFDKLYGELPYMGRDITTLILPVEFALPENVYFCYYAGAERFTRVTEYKKFTRHKDPNSTLITIEYPSKNGRLYPMPFKAEQERAQRYFDLMPDGVFSIGRAGSYRYSVDIDDCIEQAMDIRAKL